MSKAIQFFDLNTGAKIPSVGLGTWQAEDDPGLVAEAVATAIKVSYSLSFINIPLEFWKYIFVFNIMNNDIFFDTYRLVTVTLIVLNYMAIRRR